MTPPRRPTNGDPPQSLIVGGLPIGITRSLDIRPQPGEHVYYGASIWTFDAQRDGLIAPRIETVRITATQDFGAAGAGVHQVIIPVQPAKGLTLRVFRVQCFVVDGNDAGATLFSRNFSTTSVIVLQSGGAGQWDKKTIDTTLPLAPWTASIGGLGSDPGIGGRPFGVDGDELMRNAADGIGTYENSQGLVLVSPVDADPMASLFFGYERTVANNDIDIFSTIIQYTVVPTGMIPPR